MYFMQLSSSSLVNLTGMAASFASVAAMERLACFSHMSPPAAPSLAGVLRCSRALPVSASASRGGAQQLDFVQPQRTSLSSPLLSSSSPLLPSPSSSFSFPSGSENKLSRRFVLAGVFGISGIIGALNLLFIPDSQATESKQTNLPIEDVKKIIEEDIIQRQYYVTGNLTQSIYDENCRFKDPTTDVSSVKQYTAAIASLFEAETSKHEIINIGVTGPHTVEVSWRLEGYLKFPWHPYIPPYEGVTIYTTDEDGLIKSHYETWSISLLTAFIQFLIPSWLNKDAPSR